MAALALQPLVLCPGATALAASPHPSWQSLTLGNGHCAAVYDVGQARISVLRDHVYALRDAKTPTVDLCYDAYFGLRHQGKNQWLGEAKVKSAAYVPGTGISKVVQDHGGLTAEQYFFSPMGLAAPALIMVARVSAPAATSGAALFSLHNFHLGGGASGTSAERIDYRSPTHTFVEQGTTTGRVMVMRSLNPPDRHGLSPQNPYQRVKQHKTLQDGFSSGVIDDAVSGFQWDLTLKAGGAAWQGVALVAGADEGILSAALSAFLKGRGPEKLLQDEIAAWKDWQKKTVAPKGMSADEAAVYAQALAVLRMAQCREPNVSSLVTPHGQIVASLPPGKWDISWVRDAAYAIVALARAGHTAEALDGLLFMLRGRAGNYVCCDKKGGPYVGLPYAISVTRYYGDGTEESDANADGPNIEFDNFGLFLWAAQETVSRLDSQAAKAFLSTWYVKISQGVADVLVKLVEPTTGLLRADSSIWEHHWDNNKRRHHAYSNIFAVAGLRAAAWLAKMHSTAADAAKYTKAADSLAVAVNAKLVDHSTAILVSDLESFGLGPKGYMDAAVVEAFNHGVISPSSKTAASTLAAFDTYLSTAAGPGYKRNDDGDTYDEREWVIVDLRVASARFARGESNQGQKLLNWITAMARQNRDLIPELLDQKTADYAGEIPMAGFGAGGYVLALFDRAAGSTLPADGGVDSGRPDAGTPDSAALDSATKDLSMGGDATAADPGCTCEVGSSASQVYIWPLLLLALCVFFICRLRDLI